MPTSLPSSRVAQLQRIVEANGFDQVAHYRLGEAYLAEGRYAEAVAKFRRAVELNPEFAAAWRWLGEAYAQVGVHKEARAALQTGIDVARRTGDVASQRECEAAFKAQPELTSFDG